LLQPHDEWVHESLAEIRALDVAIDVDRLAEIWARGLELPQPVGEHVWLHTDLKPSNLLARDGRLAAVIDFGGLSIGYPDAEHAPTWDLPAAARAAYREALSLDDDVWRRARAWAVLVGVSGVPYYWTSYPEFAQECVRRLQAVAGEDV
ncbi:MAG: phosphotransferase, partial [Nocardioides sp.]